jgi:hypothetical protein
MSREKRSSTRSLRWPYLWSRRIKNTVSIPRYRSINGLKTTPVCETQAGEKCREEFLQAEREEDNNLRIWVDGQIVALEAKLCRPVAKVDETISYQIGVTTSFVETHFIVTDLIPNGDLVEAVTLIRKQLESLARLHELDSRPLEKLHGRTRNIGMLFRNGRGEMYGHLS